MASQYIQLSHTSYVCSSTGSSTECGVLLHSTPNTAAVYPLAWMLANMLCFLTPGLCLLVTLALLGDWTMFPDGSPHDFVWTIAYVSLGSRLLTLLFGELIFLSTLRNEFIVTPTSSINNMSGFHPLSKHQGTLGTSSTSLVTFQSHVTPPAQSCCGTQCIHGLYQRLWRSHLAYM
jgi:hypothetical protein